jgi:glycosyltransferase involved in cell wall biosynthesis
MTATSKRHDPTEATNEHPAISCLLPVYNSEKYLKESIQSILEQTVWNFELIVINDGSTDSSLAIIEEMRLYDDRIKVINQENKGIVAALNRGLAASRALFIARMDGDDIAAPDRFKIQYEFLRRNPDVVVVGGLARGIDSLGHQSYSASTGNRHRVTKLLCFPPKVVTVVHPLAMLRAEAIKSIGGYSARFPHAEDYDMLMRISEVGRIAHVEEVILDYRLHGNNVSIAKLALQERSAALAEIDNVTAARSKVGKRNLRLSGDTFDAYVAIRELRRKLELGKLMGPMIYLGLFLKIAKGVLGSEPYTTGRLLMLLTFHGIRSLRAFMRS